MKGGTEPKPESRPKTPENAKDSQKHKPADCDSPCPMLDAFARLDAMDPKDVPQAGANSQAGAILVNYPRKIIAPPEEQQFEPQHFGPPPRMYKFANHEMMQASLMCDVELTGHYDPNPPRPNNFQQQPSLTPFEVLNLLPMEMQSLVHTAKLGPEFMERQDVRQIVHGMLIFSN